MQHHPRGNMHHLAALGKRACPWPSAFAGRTKWQMSTAPKLPVAGPDHAAQGPWPDSLGSPQRKHRSREAKLWKRQLGHSQSPARHDCSRGGGRESTGGR